ncbi:MAG: GAF domain-containing protein [Deltaproteobacteria bacterium]|nr:GAF domain-containing protein [Deltaproteobacteria bacterium]
MAAVKKMVKKKPASAKKRSNAQSELAVCRKKLAILNIELEIYREIGGLSVKKNLNAVFSRLMDYVLRALETDSGTLYLLDGKTRSLDFAIVKGALAKKLKGMRISVKKGIAGRVATTGTSYVSGDLRRDKVWSGLELTKEHSNMLAVPVRLKKKVYGVIEVLNKADERPFTAEDKDTLSSLANHFSIIMERASLFTRVDERVRQMRTLHEVGSLLISTLDQAVVRHRAMEAITKLMKAETGSLLLIDRKTDELYFEVALGDKGDILKEIRLKMGEGIAGWVAVNGKPVNIHDVTRDRRFQGRFDKKSKFQTRNMVCVPVEIKGSRIGVLQAINKIGGVFEEEDVRLFQLFANQVAIALDNARLYEEIKETFYNTSEALAEAIEKRDPYTGGHTKRVLWYSLAIAKHLGMTKEELEKVKLSAVLHDVGKIGIEDAILRKQAPLDENERAAMSKHPQYGGEILRRVPQLSGIVPGMLHHHERYDGLGYPDHLKEADIPLIARIIAVADTYDAMTTTRPYRKGLPKEVALAELKKFSGIQFDGHIVEAFLRAFDAGEMEHVPSADETHLHSPA